MNRRSFLFTSLGSISLGALSGCSSFNDFFRPIASKGAIDIHTHIFNGNDVPVAGFLQQVILRDPHQPPDDNFLSGAFLRLLAGVARIGTPTAAEEIARLESEGLRVTPAGDVELQDEANLAAGLAKFTDEIQGRSAGLIAPEETAVIEKLFVETGYAPAPGALLGPEEIGRELSQRIYEREEAGRSDRYRRTSPFMQTLRWAALLTRQRTDILAELVRLYGGDEQIRVFSPSLVDFRYWFKLQERVTPREAQIQVMSLIAKQSTDAVILNFAPFCPLRAALERDRDIDADTLAVVREAVMNKGFAGVKLYPPMGFRPWNNADNRLEGAFRTPRGGGAALDVELERLYTWCAENDVPIKAHANNSIAAGICTGAFAHPAGWAPVLDAHPDLRLNLAHFGGFDEETLGDDLCSASEENWEAELSAMLERFPNLYFDIGYWTDAAGPNSPDRDRVLARTRALLEGTPVALERMMYGSDWSMIGREPGHEAYYSNVQTALSEIGLEKDELAAVEGGNARRYLGLTEGTKSFRRLAQFFGPDHLFSEVFG